MEQEKAPTYEEFFQAVKKSFWGGWRSLSEEEVDRYLATEEAQSELKRYSGYLARFNAGEITRNVFMVGGVSSVANCLILLYR